MERERAADRCKAAERAGAESENKRDEVNAAVAGAREEGTKRADGGRAMARPRGESRGPGEGSRARDGENDTDREPVGEALEDGDDCIGVTVFAAVGVGVASAERDFVGGGLAVAAAECERVGGAVDVAWVDCERVGCALGVAAAERERVGGAVRVGIAQKGQSAPTTADSACVAVSPAVFAAGDATTDSHPLPEKTQSTAVNNSMPSFSRFPSMHKS
jgi:hypothetical protein